MTPVLLVLAVTCGQSAPELKVESNGSVRHPSAVRAIAVTPDSRTAFVGLNDGSLLAYALETRKPIDVPFRVYGIINDLAVSSRGDLLAVADTSGNVRTLDTKSLKVVTAVRLKSEPDHLVFGPDDESLYVATSDGHLQKLKVSDLSTDKDILPTEGSRVLALAWSHDARVVATSDRDGQIKFWDSDSLTPLRSWKAHERFAVSLAFDPSGKYLVSGGEEAVLKVWKLADNSLLKESKEYHQESVQCIAFAPDGRMITGGYDGLCQFWDGRTFEPGKSYPNYRGYITACAISPDGHWLVRGGSSLDFVPLDRPEQVERVADFGGAILGFAVAPDRKRFATGGLDRRLILWKVDEGITSKAALLDDWITGLDFCRDGRSIAAALANGKIEIFSTETLEREKSWAAHKGRVSGLASIEGKLVSAGGDGAVHLWDLDGKRLKSYDEKAPCRSLATRRSRFAVGTANGTVSVYDLASDSPIRHLRVRPLSVTALGFSRGGYRLMVGYFDGGLESFDTESWSVVHFRPGKGESVLSIDPNPSNDLIAVGYRDGYARLFDVVSLREGPTVQSQPALEVFSARWVLDDSSLALAGATNSVLFHRVKGDVEAWTEKVR